MMETIYKDHDKDLNGISDIGGAQPGKIFSRIADVMESIQAVGKNSKNREQGYSFRSIDEVYNKVQPVMAKHRLFSVPNVMEEAREERTTKKGTVLITTLMTVRFRFYTDDGSWVDVVTRGEGMDTGDKSSNKAMTAAHKYAIIMLFAIPTVDQNDGDNESPENADGGLAPKKTKTPMLKDSPENYEKVKKSLAKLPDGHHYKKIDPATLTFTKGKGMYSFLKMFFSVQKGIEQIANRDGVTPGEINGFRDNLLKAKKKEDLEVLIDALPAPKQKVQYASKDQRDFIGNHLDYLVAEVQEEVAQRLNGTDEPLTEKEAKEVIGTIRQEMNNSKVAEEQP